MGGKEKRTVKRKGQKKNRYQGNMRELLMDMRKDRKSI
jgi:hypothetical protein